MNISVQKLLAKMEEELHLVKEENLREKVHSIKILCELILDEKQKPLSLQGMNQQPQLMVQQSMMPTATQPMMPIGQPKKLDENEEANGDSLFDF